MTSSPLSIAKLILVICFCICLSSGTGSTDVTKDKVKPTPRSEVGRSSCYSVCDSRFSSSKSEPWLACHHGCRFTTLLSQMANSKSRRNVKSSCLSACTEAYNVTSQEQACHVGCGELVKGKKRKAVTERPGKAQPHALTSSSIAPKVAPQVPISPIFRLIWSKSIVDEQEIDSSSSEDPSDPPESFMFGMKRDPFIILSSILPSSLLPNTFRVTKSTVTYFSGGKNSSSAPIRVEAPPKLFIPLPAADVLTSSTPKHEDTTAAPTQQPITTEYDQYRFLLTTRYIDQMTPEQKEKFANLTHVSLKYLESSGLAEWSIIVGFCIFLAFIFFITLFRTTGTDITYLPTSDTKKEEAAGTRVCLPGDLNSSHELLLLPPSYEQAQLSAHEERFRELYISMGFMDPITHELHNC